MYVLFREDYDRIDITNLFLCVCEENPTLQMATHLSQPLANARGWDSCVAICCVVWKYKQTFFLHLYYHRPRIHITNTLLAGTRVLTFVTPICCDEF